MKNKLLNSTKNYIVKARVELIVIAAVLLCDLLSKYLIGCFRTYSLAYTGEKRITVIPKLLYFKAILNDKAAFSFDFGLGKLLGEEGLRIFFIIFVTIAMCAFAFFMVRGVRHSKLYRISLAMIVAGGAGNLYDRIFHSAVRDFIEIEYLGLEIFGSNAFPATFNIADASLVIGVCLFVIYTIFFFSKDEKRLKAEKETANTQQIDVQKETDKDTQQIDMDKNQNN